MEKIQLFGGKYNGETRTLLHSCNSLIIPVSEPFIQPIEFETYVRTYRIHRDGSRKTKFVIETAMG